MRYGAISLIWALVLLAGACASGPGTTDPAGTEGTDSVVTAPGGSVRRVIHTPDGGRMEGHEVDGVREGPWASYYAGGGIRSRSTFVHGKEEGPTEVFHENGMTYYTGAYLHGRPVGPWVFYDAQGNEVQRAAYDSTGAFVK